MTVEQAMEFLNGAKKFGSVLGLDTITRLMHELGDPQDGLQYVHIAGTNGKGSTAAFVSSVLCSAGYNTGLYISPFIQRFGERMCFNGQQITDSELAECTQKVKEATEKIVSEGFQHPTEFELITAAGFLFFAEKSCDIVVLEVGLGGRMDATNVIKSPLAAVITNIGFDHTEYLGNTLEKIAWEKAGIIKPGCEVVLYAQSEEVENKIKEVCLERGASLTLADASLAKISQVAPDKTVFTYRGLEDIQLSMAGMYQVPNAVTAIEALNVLRKKGFNIPEKAYRDGLKRAVNIGRFELMRKDPVVMVDGAHNPQGVNALIETLQTVFPGEKIKFIVGMLADKDYETSIKTLAPLAKSFATITPPSERALDSYSMAARIKELTGLDAVAYDSPEIALDTQIASAGKDEIICVLGSLYQVGKVREYFGK